MKAPIRTLRKHLSWHTILFVLIVAGTVSVTAAPGTTILVEPYASIAQVGEPFTINVTITDVQNLYGVEVVLHWNASILRLVNLDVRLGTESHPDGILHEPIFIAKNETVQNEGKYLLAATSMAPADSFSGNGNIVKITFNVIGNVSCNLDLETELRGKPPPGDVAPIIEHTTADGFFGHQIGISALPTAVKINQEVNVSGYIIPPQANVEVTIFSRSENEVNWLSLGTVRTDTQGTYHFEWHPEEGGKNEIRASAAIEGTEETSSSIYITVEKPEQSTWVDATTIAVTIIILIVISTILIYRKRIRKLGP